MPEASGCLWQNADALPDELIEVLAEGKGMRIERIVSTGQQSPEGFWYDQEEHEFVLVVAGEAVLEFEDRRQKLKSGDWLLIPSHCRHRVVYTHPEQATVWLAVFYTP